MAYARVSRLIIVLVALVTLFAVSSDVLAAKKKKPAKKKNPTIPADDYDKWKPEPYIGAGALGYTVLQGPGVQAGLPRRANLQFDKDGSAVLVSERILFHIGKDRTVRIIAGRPGMSGFQDGPAQLARFNKMNGVARDGKGGFYVNDRGNVCIRHVFKKEDGSWWVETIAGTPGTAGRKDGPAKEAQFDDPCNLAINSKGELFTCDRNFIRKIAGGEVTTLNPKGGSGFKDGPLEEAKFQMIMGAGCAFDDQDNLFICDRWNHRFRKIDFKTNQATTYAGSGKSGHHIDGEFGTCTVEPGGLAWNPKRKSFYAVMVDSANLGRLEGGWLKTVGKSVRFTGLDRDGNIYAWRGRKDPVRFYRFTLQEGEAKEGGAQ